MLDVNGVQVYYTWYAGDPGDRWTPHDPPQPEVSDVYFRGRKLKNLKPANLYRLEDEIWITEEEEK